MAVAPPVRRRPYRTRLTGRLALFLTRRLAAPLDHGDIHQAAQLETDRLVESDCPCVRGEGMQVGLLAPLPDAAHHDQRELPREPASTDARMRAYAAHFREAVLLHPLAGHRDEYAVLPDS